MPKILLSLSAVFIIVAATFSFLAKPKIEATSAELKQKKTELDATAKSLAKIKDDIKAAADQASSEKLRADTFNTERTALKSELSAAKTQLAQAKDELAKTTLELDAAKKLAQNTPAPGAATPALDEINTKLKEAETKVGELEQVNKTLQEKNTDTENKLAALQKAENSRQSSLMRKGLTGQVLAVNRSYNFVVLSIGDKQGVVMNGEMVIKRGSTQVARVKVTSVEPTTSIADVVPGSTLRDSFVQPGDEVIYPGAGI